jgi:ribonuclease III
MAEYDEFLKKIEIQFKNKELFNTVFIHRSYLNEHKSLKLEHNERLEFLGDAVLELAVTRFLFNNYNKPEGEMTNWRSALVKGESLSTEAKKLGMDGLIKTSRGESKNVGKARDLILANAFEALIGAIYIDQGFEPAATFIEKFICYKIKDIVDNELYYDSKSKFQEMAQEKFGITPIYELVSEVGPDHNKVFTVCAYIGKNKISEGQGSSKQRAQLDAAKNSLERWDEIS